MDRSVSDLSSMNLSKANVQGAVNVRGVIELELLGRCALLVELELADNWPNACRAATEEARVRGWGLMFSLSILRLSTLPWFLRPQFPNLHRQARKGLAPVVLPVLPPDSSSRPAKIVIRQNPCR
jgi:hypothetical protein